MSDKVLKGLAGAKAVILWYLFLEFVALSATVSTKVFQDSQCGHLPNHLGLVPPHSVQEKSVFSLAMHPS
jgi:hypothetical protein